MGLHALRSFATCAVALGLRDSLLGFLPLRGLFALEARPNFVIVVRLALLLHLREVRPVASVTTTIRRACSSGG